MSVAACNRHPNIPSEGACDACGRPVCLRCAVPFRGELRCGPCAAREVGEPADETPAAPRGTLGMDRAAGLAFLGGVLASMLPWDRVGSRTGFLGAWSPTPDPWPLLASVLLLLGAVSALRPAPEGLSPRTRMAYVAFGALAMGATLLALPTPDFTVRTAVPYLVLTMAVVGTALGAVRLGSSPAPAERP